MADVDTTPQQPETLGSVDNGDAPEEPEVPPTQGSEEAPAETRDSPEGDKDGQQEAADVAQEEVQPPEPQPAEQGAAEDVGKAQIESQPEAAQDPGNSESEPQQPPAEDPATDNVQSDVKEKGGDERGGAEGAEEEEEEEKDRGKEDAHQPPPTPTFSSEHEEDVDDTNRAQAEEALQAETRAEAADVVADQPLPPESALTPAGGQPGNAKRLTNTPLEGAGLPLKPPTAQLPPVARGQVRGQQMTSAITDALRHNTQPPAKQLIRARRPPKYIRLATVTVSPARARPLPQGPSLYYEEPRRPKKVITWDEATNARPPLRIDMEGPTPCSYTPRVKPLNETNAPSFTFGSKCSPEKTGGSRTAWTKSWFQTPHVWHSKADFLRDTLWPSPSHYPKGSSLGPRQRTMPEAPSYTFGHKTAYSIVKPGAPKEPSPNEYKRQMADRLVLPRGPSFTHQLRREGTMLWGAAEVTPGPAAYSPQKPSPERPSFTIQGIRREKSHILGPYSSL